MASHRAPSRAESRQSHLTSGVVALLMLAALVVVLTGGGATASADSYSRLYNGTEVPVVSAEPDANAVELGVKVTVDVPSTVVAIAYYKSAQNSGVHTGSVWSPSGTLLTNGQFTGETTVGWQQLTLATPVTLLPGNTYVVSYHTTTGHYAQQEQVFAGGAQLGGGLIRGVGGVYAYGGSSFPHSSWHAAAYFVDAIVRAATTPPPPSSSAPQTSASAPSSSTSVPRTSNPPSTSASAPKSSSSAPSTSAPAPSTSSSPPPTHLNCAAVPHVCGYPDATNTGVPAGTVLRSVPGQVRSGLGWHWDSRGFITVDGDGAVLSGLAVRGAIEVSASDVTIRACDIQNTGTGWGVGLRSGRNVTVEDSNIYSPATSGPDRLMVSILDFGGDVGLRVLRNDIWHVANGGHVEAGVFSGNYIHDMIEYGGDHVDGMGTWGGNTNPLTIEHNTIFDNVDGGVNAVYLNAEYGPQRNRTVHDNLLAGGGFTIYGGVRNGGSATSNIKITGNRISNLYYPKGGFYGPAAYFDSGAPGNVWSGNIWDATGKTISAP